MQSQQCYLQLAQMRRWHQTESAPVDTKRREKITTSKADGSWTALPLVTLSSVSHSLPTDSLAGSGAPLALVVGFSRGHVRVVLGFPSTQFVEASKFKKKKKKMARLRSAALVTRSRLDMET